MCPPRESVGSSQWTASGRSVIDAYWSARRMSDVATHRAPVVREAGRALVGELAHLGQLGSLLALRDRREEADRDLGLARGPARSSAPSTAAESTTGSVFGIARIAQ